MTEQEKPLQTREELFRKAEEKLQHPAEFYRLGERFEGLDQRLSSIVMLDVTKIPGCHYGARNVFVPMIKDLEQERTREKSSLVISPETTILVEPSMGNGWVAFSDAAEMLGYEHIVVMPDGLPEPRYKHPQGREVQIIRTPKEDFVAGMSRKLKSLINENRQRLRDGKKIYACPDHGVNRVEITAKAMSDLGRQLLENIGEAHDPITIVATMGNGSSIYGIGGYVKEHRPGSKVLVTESFNYGGGYDRFAETRDLPSYKELFGIDPGNPDLMKAFEAYGSNAPIGITMPLQERLFAGDIIDRYILFSDNDTNAIYASDLKPSDNHLKNALSLPNHNELPQALIDTYGNTTIANIAAASRFSSKDEVVVAIAYDGRGNY
jgi:hypothetical protein